MVDLAGSRKFYDKIPRRVLFFMYDYSDVSVEKNIHTDLVTEVVKEELEVVVVAPAVSNFAGLRDEGGVQVLRVHTGTLSQTNPIVKGVNTVLLPLRFAKAVRNHLADWNADWIVAPTPPVTLSPLIRRLKHQWQSRFYLILRDIFPQNAVDLGMMKPGLIHAYFRRQEVTTYRSADIIGCMSPGNMEYIRRHNPFHSLPQLVMLPNWTSSPLIDQSGLNIHDVRRNWSIPHDKFIVVFGGNLGKPQRIDFLMDAITLLNSNPDIYFVVAGRGTESNWFDNEVKARQLTNVRRLPRLSREEYDELLFAADLGIITLSEKFTIPNIPSRLVGYWSAGLPVLAATDVNTDLNSSFIQKFGGGQWVEMGRLKDFVSYIEYYSANPEIARQAGANGRQAVKEKFSSRRVAQSFLEQLGVPVGQ